MQAAYQKLCGDLSAGSSIPTQSSNSREGACGGGAGGGGGSGGDFAEVMAGQQWESLLGQLKGAGLVSCSECLVHVRVSAGEAKAALGEEAMNNQFSTVCAKLRI